MLAQWSLIEADLHQHYGIDIDDPAVRTGRSWRWLRLRILCLLSTDSRVARHFAPSQKGGRTGGR